MGIYSLLTSTCLSARQYTQKFKSWGLQKNERRNAERKPRSFKASIYRNGINSSQGSQALASGELYQEETDDIPESRSSRSHVVQLPSQTSRNLYKTVLVDPAAGALQSSGKREHHISASAETRTHVLSQQGSQSLTHNTTIQEEFQGTRDNPQQVNGHRSDISEEWANGATTEQVSALPVDRYIMEATNLWSFSSSMQLWATIEEQTLSTIAHCHRMTRDTLTQDAWRIWTLAVWQIWFQGDLYHFGKLHRIAERPKEREPELVPLAKKIEPHLQAWLNLYRKDVPEVQARARLLAGSQVCEVSLTWQTYAGLGYKIALQRGRWNAQDIKPHVISQGQSLSTAMMQDSGHAPHLLRRGFEEVLKFCRRVLKHKIHEMKTICEQLTDRFHFQPPKAEEGGLASRNEQANVAVLSMVFQSRLKDLRTGARERLTVATTQMTGFTTEKAFLWAARLMLYYACPELDKSPLPASLCARALDGSSRIFRAIHAHPSQDFQVGKSGIINRGVFSDFWQDSNFVNLWVEWLCCDSDFFLHCYSE